MSYNNKKQIKKNIVVGLTGGIACGKSTAAKYFVKYGAKLIDADVIAKEVLAINSEGYKKVVKYFGVTILNKNNSINRVLLLKIVSNNKIKLNALNNITHPLVLSQINKTISKLIKSGAKLIVVDAPLLFESGFNKNVDFTAVVCAKLAIRIKRVLKSGKMPISVFNKLRRAQMPLIKKCEIADFVIANNGSVSQLESSVIIITKLLIDKYLR